MSDPYAPLCLHGTLPLVGDPGSPGGVRFGIPEGDAVADCISRPDGLPDAEMTLRAFKDRAERTGYVAALAEHGGNAFSVVESPDTAQGFPLALVIRHDRPRAEADSLDGAVRFQGPPESATAWTRHRSIILDMARDRREKAAVAERWDWATKAAEAAPDVMVLGVGRDGVEIVPRGGYAITEPRLRLTEDAGGRCLDWKAPPTELDAAGAAALARKERSLGVTDEGGRKRIPVPPGTDVGQVVEAAKTAMKARKALVSQGTARTRMARIAANPEAAPFVAALARGLPVLQPRRDGPGALPDEGGATLTMSSAFLRHLQMVGLARLGWEPRDGDFSGRYPRVILGTEAAALLHGGDVVEAARKARPDPEPRFAKPLHGGDFDRALASMRDKLPERARASLAALAARMVPPEGMDAPGRESSHKAWLPVVLGVLSGLYVMEDGRLQPADDGARPRPPGA